MAQARFEHLTNRDGLSQMNVLTILQDRRGFMWFGTHNGLNRWDGYQFRIFELEPSNWIRKLREDREGRLWVATPRGLHRFDPALESFEHFAHDSENPASLSHDRILDLYLDSAGDLWIGSEAGLDFLDTETGLVVRHPRPTAVRAIAEDPSGDLWIGTASGLERFPRQDGGFASELPDPAAQSLSIGAIHALLVDRSGSLWIGTDEGIDRFDPGSGSFAGYRRMAEASHPVSDILEDASGRLWIGFFGLGLASFHPATGQFAFYRHDPHVPTSLGHDTVLDLYFDRSGILWVGTSTGGVDYLDPTRTHFELFRHDRQDPGSLGHDLVLDFHEENDGHLWVATLGGGLDRYDPGTGHFEHFRHDPQDLGSLGSDAIYALHGDEDGRLWIGTESGLDLYDPRSGEFQHFRHDARDPTSLAHDRIRSLSGASDGRLWIGTFSAGLDRYDPRSRRFEHFRHDPDEARSISPGVPMAVVEDKAGRFWIGIWGGGLDRFDPETGEFEHHRHDPQDPKSLAQDIVRCLFLDRSGNLWIGTDGRGLDLLSADGTRFRHYTTADGLADNVIQGILEDDQERLWISTNRGLTCFDPRTERFTLYDTRDGLQDLEFNFGSCHRGASGRLYFGGIRGFNAFDPGPRGAEPASPPLVLTSFEVLGREVPLPRAAPYLEAVELGFRENYFSFEMAALSFLQADRIHYAYRLDGFEENWRDAGLRRYASYSHLPAGDYVLRLRASRRQGEWSEAAPLKIKIRQIFWRSGWAYLLYGLILFWIVWFFFRRQKRAVESERNLNRQLREMDRLKDEFLGERSAQLAERERLIAELHAKNMELEAKNVELERFNYTVSHDLKNPLVTIKGFLGLLRQDFAAGDTERIEDDIERISHAAEHMRRLLEELLELSRVGRRSTARQTVVLSELAQEAAELLAAELEKGRVDVEIAPDLPVITGDRTQLLEVFINLLANAVKFMGEEPAPRIEIGRREEEGLTVCFVRDNGVGIDPRYHQKIFGLFERLDPEKTEGTGIGLALVKRILEVHGGCVWVESEGRGATFCFTLPASDSL